jgi:hypothetical protein
MPLWRHRIARFFYEAPTIDSNRRFFFPQTITWHEKRAQGSDSSESPEAMPKAPISFFNRIQTAAKRIETPAGSVNRNVQRVQVSAEGQ